MSHTPRPPPPRRPPHPIDDDAHELRVQRAREELARRGMLRTATEPDPGVRRDASGRAVERTTRPSPRGGIAVVGYRRSLPGDSTSDDEPPRRPDGSYSGGDEPLALDEPTETEAPRVGGGAPLAPIAPPRPLSWAAVTEPGADPVRLVGDHVRVYLDRSHLACLVGILVGLSILAGIGIAALVVGLAVLRSHA